MAMDQEEFKFPHEQENDNKSEKDDDTFEVEVVDDTPAEDRNRTPAAEPPSDPTDEELARYDESVQKRIKHFTKGYHDERRAKEAAQREREEAVRLAQQLVEENKKLKGSLSQGQTALLEQAKKVVANELEAAKRKYKEALESFDTEATVAAQEALMKIQLKAERVNNFKPAPLQKDEPAVKPQQIQREEAPQQPLDTKLLAWQERNKWFGPNRRLTAYALGLHEDLQAEGVQVGSEDYYGRIDKEMRQRFPDEFGGRESADAPTQRTRTTNVVASAGRSVAPKKVTLTKSQEALAKRLGVPLELYARKVAEEMRK